MLQVHAKAPVSCRLIGESDLDGVVDLLTRGFQVRTADYWRRGLAQHAAHPVPDGCPAFGFLMESDGRPVGVLLTLYSTRDDRRSTGVRCNLSSWYVEPRFRAFAPLLDQVARRHRHVTYVNISAAPHTWAMHEARGYERYCTGQMLAFPLLGPARRGVRLRAVRPGDTLDDLPAFERRLVADHARLGCICLIASDEAGSRPFVFLRRPVDALRYRIGWSPLHYGQLVYCRATSDLTRFAGAVGRHLLRHHALPCVLVDANAKLDGLAGLWLGGRGTRFKRGPDTVRLGDLAYSELVLFGP